MEAVGERLMGDKMPTWYGRDAANVRKANAVVIIGADRKPLGVPNCGYCGFGDCKGCENAGGNCAFAYVDLGIAVSSAVSAASNDYVDCRIMFSIESRRRNGFRARLFFGLEYQFLSPEKTYF